MKEYTYAELEALVIHLVNRAGDTWYHAKEHEYRGNPLDEQMSIEYGQEASDARDELLAYLKTVASDETETD